MNSLREPFWRVYKFFLAFKYVQIGYIILIEAVWEHDYQSECYNCSDHELAED